MSNYFDFQEADARDKQLVLAKEMNIVPEGCLLNGSLVMGLHYTAPVDHHPEYVCRMCKEGPRERCGGAAYVQPEATEDDLSGRDRHLLSADDASFRGIERKRIIGLLDDLC
jgi:hypothetical protein